MNRQNNFSYWKYPLQKWLILLLGLFQIPLLAENIKDFRFSLHTNIFSPEALSAYQNSSLSELVVSVFILCTTVGFFLIGAFCRSRKTARLFESILLFACAGLAAIGLYPLWAFKTPFFLCLFLLLLSLLLGAFSLHQYGKEKA